MAVISKPMKAEYTPDHFKLYCPCIEHWIFVNIYANKKRTPAIFDRLFLLYREDWLTEYESALKARSVVKDFFTACELLSKEWKIPPFSLKINILDFSKFKNGVKEHTNGCIVLQELQPRPEWVQNNSWLKVLLSNWPDPKEVWPSEGEWKLRKSSRWNRNKVQWEVNMDTGGWKLLKKEILGDIKKKRKPRGQKL